MRHRFAFLWLLLLSLAVPVSFSIQLPSQKPVAVRMTTALASPESVLGSRAARKSPCPDRSVPQMAGAVFNTPIEALAEDQSSITVASQGKPLTVAAKTKDFQTRLKDFRRGDWVDLEWVADQTGINVLQGIGAACVVHIGTVQRVMVLILAFVSLLIFSWLILGRRLPELLLGRDQRYSNSKFQIVTWFGVVVLTYIAAVYLRARYGGGDFIGNVNLPQNLLLMSGLSAFTFAAAKAITTAKVQAAKDRALAVGGGATAALAAAELAKPPATVLDRRQFFANLLMDDNRRVDIGDFQMVVLTALAVAVYLVKTFSFLGSVELLSQVSLPDVDSTILATFGLGQGAYLTKKYAGDGA